MADINLFDLLNLIDSRIRLALMQFRGGSSATPNPNWVTQVVTHNILSPTHGDTFYYAIPADGDVLMYDGITDQWKPSASSGGGHVIQNQGTNLTQRANLNFYGGSVVASDDPTNDATLVTIESGSSPSIHVDGALAIASEVGSYVVVVAGVISVVYIYCSDPGAAGSTIVDVNLNGVTIFTTQGNRPTLAYDDADKIAVSGTPDIMTLAAGDLLTFDIDATATGVKGLTVVVALGGTPVTEEDDMVKLDSVTVGAGGAAEIEFAAIAATYNALKIILTGRSDDAGSAYGEVVVTLNDDTDAKYDYVQHESLAVDTVSVTQEEGHAHCSVGVLPAAGGEANIAGQIEITLIGYAGTTFYKQLRADGAYTLGATDEGDFRLGSVGGWYRDTDAVASIQLTVPGGNFVEGTVAVLYGLK